MTDIEIAKSVELEKISKIAEKLDINEEDIVTISLKDGEVSSKIIKVGE